MSGLIFLLAGAAILAAGFFIGRRFPAEMKKNPAIPADFEKRMLEAVHAAEIPETERKQWVNWFSYDGGVQEDAPFRR